MNTIIKYLKVIAIVFVTILILPLFLSLGNLLKIKTSNITIIIFMIASCLVSGFLLGKKISKKGYLNGFILGILNCLLLFIISLFFNSSYSLNTLIYYLIIISSSMFGAIIGVNKNNAK